MKFQSQLLVASAFTSVLACPDHPTRKYAARQAGTPTSSALYQTLTPLPLQSPIPTWFNVTEFPNEQKENVTALLNEAESLSHDFRIRQYFQDQCITVQLYSKLFVQPSGHVIPFSPFDNFYFVGQAFVSSWAYDTGDGLVLIDALDDDEEVEQVMLPALESFGFSGSDIKHVIITHEHVDHYGGAKYLQDNFGSKIYGSDMFWRQLATFNVTGINSPEPPVRDQTVEDGQVLTIGNVDVEIVLTPGHTPGTLSLIFPVTLNNGTEKHVVGLNGGTGNPSSARDRSTKVSSNYKMADLAYERGVDVLLSNHQIADHTLFNADLMDHAQVNSTNPWIVGKENYRNFQKILGLCTKVLSAREGADIWV